MYQGAYCEREVTDARALKNLIKIVDSDTKEIELPKSSPSIRQTIDQGEKYMHVDSRNEHIEEYKEIDSLVREVKCKIYECGILVECGIPAGAAKGAVFNFRKPPPLCCMAPLLASVLVLLKPKVPPSTPEVPKYKNVYF